MSFKANLRQPLYESGALRLSAKVVIIDSTGEILLQRRDMDEQDNGGQLGAFGGGFDPARPESTAAEVLANELREELQRNINPWRAVPIRYFSEVLDRGPRNVCYFFWRNTGLPLTECNEGKIERFDGSDAILKRGDIGYNLRKVVQIARDRWFIPA